MLSAAILFLWCAWGYAGCGWLPARRQGWRGFPAGVAAVLASFGLLFAAALLLQLAAVPLTRGAWFATTAGLSLLACLLPAQAPRPPVPAGPGVTGGGWVQTLLIGAVVFALGVIVFRAVAQPLTGPDTIFRWDFLARQIVAQRGLGFYPAVGDSDLMHYMWPESIPPLVSLLYAWGYLGAGSTAPAVTAPVVILGAGGCFALVAALAARRGGRAAANWAVALLAGSAVHTWSVSLGQETGLTTVSVLAFAWAAGDESTEPDWRLAGLAAGLTALSRDYGLALAGFGLAWLVGRRRPARELAGFSLVVLALVLPWYVRTWLRTGNPFYSLDLFGCFPVNTMLAGLMHSFVERYGFAGHATERLAELAGNLWPLGMGVLIAALASMRLRLAWPVSCRWLAGLWIGLWLWSVGYTAGGLGYSLRVLSPVLALLAVAGGVALAQTRPAGRSWLAVALVLLAGEASVRALVMMAPPSAVPLRQWREVGTTRSALRGDARHDQAVAIIGTHRVLVDNAYTHAYLTARGVTAVPVWSPGVDFICAPHPDVPEILRRLQTAGVDYLWLSTSRDLRVYFDRYPFFEAAVPALRPVLSGDDWVLFAIKPPARG